jgi:tocopherol O-methyltransferase
VTTVEDFSVQVRRTWTICARRLLGRIATQPKYARFLLDTTARNRIFAVTMLRLILAYRTGAMRYCLLIAQR